MKTECESRAKEKYIEKKNLCPTLSTGFWQLFRMKFLEKPK